MHLCVSLSPKFVWDNTEDFERSSVYDLLERVKSLLFAGYFGLSIYYCNFCMWNKWFL